MIVGGIVTAALAAFACSSSSGGGGNNSCVNSAASQGSAACGSCLESKCGSQLSAAESGCSDLLSCECPGGTFSATAAASSACQAKAMESSCSGPYQDVGSCITSNCDSECNPTSSSGSGSSSGSSSSGSSSGSTSSGGTPTGSCASLSTCCGMLPAADQPSCTALADQNNQQDCQLELGGFDDAGLCH
ncbi:MAG TPA: hypothetical protein VGL81_36730 [Polyangiaceae bacterium]